MKSIWKFILCALVVSVFASGAAFAKSEDGNGKEKKDPAKMFARADADGDGSITLEEFTVIHEKRMEKMKERRGDNEPPAGAKTPPTAEEIFIKMDSNGDGSVTIVEFEEHINNRKAQQGHKGEKKKGGKKNNKNADEE